MDFATHLPEIIAGIGALGSLIRGAWYFIRRQWKRSAKLDQVAAQITRHEAECLVVNRENANRLDTLMGEVRELAGMVKVLLSRDARD